MEDMRKKILVTGDSKTFLMYISILLRRMGFDVIPAVTSVEVLKILKLHEPDAVFVDTMSPNRDSIEILAKMRKDECVAHIPVIVVSTRLDAQFMEECEELNCSGFLTKPIKIDELNNILYRCITFPRHKKRKHLRVPFEENVILTCGSVTEEVSSVNLSEGGIFIRKVDPLPAGENIRIELPLKKEKCLALQGIVVHRKDFRGEVFTSGPGMGIQFKDLSESDAELLREYIKELLAGDIHRQQEEPTISLDEEE